MTFVAKGFDVEYGTDLVRRAADMPDRFVVVTQSRCRHAIGVLGSGTADAQPLTGRRRVVATVVPCDAVIVPDSIGPTPSSAATIRRGTTMRQRCRRRISTSLRFVVEQGLWYSFANDINVDSDIIDSTHQTIHR